MDMIWVTKHAEHLVVIWHVLSLFLTLLFILAASKCICQLVKRLFQPAKTLVKLLMSICKASHPPFISTTHADPLHLINTFHILYAHYIWWYHGQKAGSPMQACIEFMTNLSWYLIICFIYKKYTIRLVLRRLIIGI